MSDEATQDEEKILDAVTDPGTARDYVESAETTIAPPGRPQDVSDGEPLSLGEDVPGVGLPPPGGYTDRRVEAQVDRKPDPDDGPPAPPNIG